MNDKTFRTETLICIRHDRIPTGALRGRFCLIVFGLTCQELGFDRSHIFGTSLLRMCRLSPRGFRWAFADFAQCSRRAGCVCLKADVSRVAVPFPVVALSICLSVCLSLSLRLSVCLSVCLSLSLSLSSPPPQVPVGGQMVTCFSAVSFS